MEIGKVILLEVLRKVLTTGGFTFWNAAIKSFSKRSGTRKAARELWRNESFLKRAETP